MEIIKFSESKQIAFYAASFIAREINNKPDSSLGLTTGSTSIETYKILIEKYKKKTVDFSKVTAFTINEFFGFSIDDECSLASFIKRNFYNDINILPPNMIFFDGKAANTSTECVRFDSLLLSKGGIDLQFLGLGSNGHVAFNEPADTFPTISYLAKLEKETILSNAHRFKSVEATPKYAYTMGIGMIFQAVKILLVAMGKEKANTIRQVILGPVTPKCPASLLQIHNNVTVLLDSDASSALEESSALLKSSGYKITNY